MTSSAPFRRFAFAFGTTFAILYVVALAKDVALFTVFPSLGVVLAGTHHTRDVADPAMGFLAPAIYWYGWAATAALGALIIALVAASFTRTFGAIRLAGMGVGISYPLDDCLRLSNSTLVSTLVSKRRNRVVRTSKSLTDVRTPHVCRNQLSRPPGFSLGARRAEVLAVLLFPTTAGLLLDRKARL